jgi:ATP-binding cassette subfamily B protein
MSKINVKQHDIADCGATCLASISAHYNLQIPIARIRQYVGTDKKGTNVLELIEAAEKLGFEAKGARGELDRLFKIPKPITSNNIISKFI